jgi:membrane associated rhomboid family serine protease
MSDDSLTTIRKSPDSDKWHMIDALMASLAVLFVCWAVFLMDEYLGIHTRRFGMAPRTWEGLRGLITMHFLHGDWKHLTQNSLGFLVLNSFLFYFYRSISIKVLLWSACIGAIVLWMIGRPSNHIGLSLVIYGEFAFLLVSGFIRRNTQMLRVALLVTLYYGSLVWYILPIDHTISWEGHLGGFLAGCFVAWWFRKQGPQRTFYRYELEPELLDDENAYWKVPKEPPVDPPKQHTSVSIRYHYTEGKKDA